MAPRPAALALRSPGRPALAAVPTNESLRSPRKRSTVNVAAYVEARASGASEAEAMRAAGSTAKSPAALARQAARVEARPDVRSALAEARQSVLATTSRAWRTGIARIEGIVTDPLSSNFDVLGAMGFLAKLRGEYAPAKVAVKEEREITVIAAFTGMAGSIPGEECEYEPLPHVVAPDAGGMPED
jgi:hypothetical protein